MSTDRRYSLLQHNHDDTYLPLAAGSTYPLTGDLWINSGQPNIWLKETDQAAGSKVWRMVASGGVFYAQVNNDDITVSNTWLSATRSGATGVSNIALNSSSTIQLTSPYVDQISTTTSLYGRLFYNTSTLAGYLCGNADGIGFLTTGGSWGARMAGASGHLYLYNSLTMLSTSAVINIGAGGLRYGYFGQGTTYSNAASVIGNNIYVNPADTVSGQVRTAITHASYGHTIYEQYGGSHYWYGNNNSVTADAVVTKRTLMTLSVAGSCQVLDEFRTIGSSVVQNGTGFYVNSSAPRLITDPNGSYGTISLIGSKNTYSGIRFDASNKTANLMFATGSALWGVYVESPGAWDLLYNSGHIYINSQAQILAEATLSAWGTSCRLTRGTAAPSGGTDGDIYFRTSPIGLYLNVSGTWTLIAS